MKSLYVVYMIAAFTAALSCEKDDTDNGPELTDGSWPAAFRRTIRSALMIRIFTMERKAVI
jgi:hypothetical protein